MHMPDKEQRKNMEKYEATNKILNGNKDNNKDTNTIIILGINIIRIFT